METKRYKIEDVILDISMGPFGSDIKKEVYTDYGVPVLNGSNLQGFELVEDSFGYVTEEKADSLKKANARRGDIVITHRGTIGQIVYIPYNSKFDRYVISQSQFRVTCNTDIVLPEYLTYYFHTREGQHKLLSNASQVGVPALARASTTFRKLEVDLPSVEIQRKAMDVILGLQQKIAVNRRICENLETQAQTLFKNWFIDFAPFKDANFIETELGLIPEGLIYKRIEEIPHTLETGKRPAGGVKGIDSGIPSIGAENIKGLGCYDYSKTKFVPEEYAASMKKGKIKGYELLIYKDGGKPGYFIPNFAIFGEGYPYQEMCLNEHVFKLDFGNKGYSLFAYFFFKTKQIMSYLNAQGAKAAIPGINSKDIEVIMMPSLENECVQKYCNEVEDIITQILVLSKESSRLSALRDTLLPKLMSGQIKL